MAAKGIQFPRRGYGGMISTNLEVIREMSVYDKIELPRPAPIVTRVELYAARCPHCSARFVAPVPAGLEPGSPFTPSTEAMAVYMRYEHAVSYQRLSKLFADLHGLTISQAALANLFKRVKPGFDARFQAVLARLRQSRIVCSDETGARIKGHNAREWVFQNDEVCVHVIRNSRAQQSGEGGGRGRDGRPPARHLGVRSLRRPAAARGGLANLSGPPVARRPVCHRRWRCDLRTGTENAHLARLCSGPTAKASEGHYTSEIPGRPGTANGQGYGLSANQPTNKDGIRLRKRSGKDRDSLFTFMTERDVPPTNNGSEQAIRPSTTLRKVTGGFRSNWGADFYANVRSVLNTGKRQGLSAFQAIQAAIAGKSVIQPG